MTRPTSNVATTRQRDNCTYKVRLSGVFVPVAGGTRGAVTLPLVVAVEWGLRSLPTGDGRTEATQGDG